MFELTTEMIEDYLSLVSKKIFNRGKNLFEEGNVIASKYFPADMRAEFKILGSITYNVVFTWDDFDLLDNCECPFDWEDICKHRVAAALQMKQDLQNGKISPVNDSKNLTVTIPSLVPNLDDILELTPMYNQFNSGFQIIDLAFKNSSVVAFLKEPNWMNDGSIHEIEIARDNQSLISKCSCKQYDGEFCKHQYTLFRYMTQNPAFFEAFDQNKLESRKVQLLESIGITPDNGLDSKKDLFELDWQGQWELISSKEAEGVIPLTGKNKLEQWLTSNLDTKENARFVLPEKKAAKSGKLRIGFILDFKSDTTNQIFNLIPFQAKLNKAETRLMSNFNYVKSPTELDTIDLTTEEKELFEISERVSAYFQGVTRSQLTSENHHEIIKGYQSFVDQLKNKLSKVEYFYEPKSLVQTWRPLAKKDIEEITIQPNPFNLEFTVSETQKFFSLEASLNNGIKVIKLPSNKISIISSFFIKLGDTYFLENDLVLLKDIQHFSYQGNLKFFKDEFDRLFDQIIHPLSQKYFVKFSKMKSVKVRRKQLIPTEHKKQLFLNEVGDFVIFKPVVNYDDKIETNVLEFQTTYIKEDGEIIPIKRNQELESSFQELIRNLHPKFQKQKRTDFLNLNFHELLNDNWFMEALDTLRENDVEVYGVNDLEGLPYSPYRAVVSTSIKSDQDWFDIDTGVSFGDEFVSLKQVKKALTNKERFVKLSDGKKGLLPEKWLKKVERYLRNGELKGDTVKISKLRFSLVDELFEELENTDFTQEISKKRDSILNAKDVKQVTPPQALKATLRDYQKEGLNWLNFLKEHNWGGILADDMGLGKTIQVLANLLNTKSEKANLIIVPTSLIFNWEKEIEKFCPNIKLFTHYGKNRISKAKEFDNYEIILTSYGLMVNDIKLFSKHKFNYLILDESQAIKNPSSQRYKAACTLKGMHKLAMTGTPIENNTFDLFAQMTFVNPGYLGTMTSFKKMYSTPIDSDKNTVIAAELQKLINPFVLRRTKEKVATELPPKTEDYIFCNMESEQRKVYDAYRNEIRDRLEKKIDENGVEKSKMLVLEALLKLRQICDSPRLLNDVDSYGEDAIKIKELLRHIKDKTANHKILVFSQFVKMLELIKNQLEFEGIEFEYLDGSCSTKERENSVQEFQNNNNCRVFLISLKAGGTGLNLTEADYVYIVDPWWNPAAENQAIDRCYRIGQTKKVIAYRMICKDTIEEKIMSLQDKKKRIASDIITADESILKSLNKEDIQSLFA